MTRTILGIDLGTTYSLVAAMHGDRPLVLPNALGELLTPSAVSLDEHDVMLVGAPARARATTHPTRTALSFKRDMGTARAIALADRTFTAPELSALVLAQLKRDAEVALGTAVDEAVITVPAYFGDAQRQATRDAGAIAGLIVDRIINEPTAAALAYGLHARQRELRAVVIDLGGGTFDVTVLEILEGVIEVQASSGDTRLGGDDFDLVLTDLAIDGLPDAVRDAVRDDAQARARVRHACERAKHELSTHELASVVLHALPAGAGRTTDLELPIPRARAELAWQPLIERMKLPIARALRDAALRPEQVDEVLVVGGATRMPCVRKLVSQKFGRPPLHSLPADEAVALGAAVQAGLKAGHAALDDLVVTDIVPFSLGVDVAEDLGPSHVAGLFSPIIERGTVIPVSREHTYRTMYDHQRSVTLGIYQGEHSLVEDNSKLGAIAIRDLDPLPAGEHTFRVRFTYDLNGILDVDVTTVKTGKTQSIVIEGAPGKLTAKQLAHARARMARLKFHPREALPNATLLARADAVHVELVGRPREAMRHAIAAFRAVLEAQDERAIPAAHAALTHIVEAYAAYKP